MGAHPGPTNFRKYSFQRVIQICDDLFNLGSMGGIATMFMVLLHVVDHLHEVNSESRAGRMFSAFKCTGSDESRCAILDVPKEKHNSVSRGQCISACNSHDWNWVNFIENEISSSTGQCQLFSHQPRTTTNISGCTLYKVGQTGSSFLRNEYN